MNYRIEYTVLCEKGIIRQINQDNFWCMGQFLESKNDGLSVPITGAAKPKDSPAFAVFDGMGGEQQGEVAAYIAAKIFDARHETADKNDLRCFLLDACTDMNQAICDHANERLLKGCGATAAVLMFGKKEIYICNIGDSRVYQFSGKTLTQISKDHSETSAANKKPYLTQHLGIPREEFIIAPYVAKGVYGNRRYLICSDGLTDMVADGDIAKMLAQHRDVTACANVLMQAALDAGGKDNITIILCEVRKRGLFRF